MIYLCAQRLKVLLWAKKVRCLLLLQAVCLLKKYKTSCLYCFVPRPLLCYLFLSLVCIIFATFLYFISMNQIKPIPDVVIEKLLKKNKIYFFEEGIKNGAVGERIAYELLEKGYKGKYSLSAIDNKFVEQATVEQLLDIYKLDALSMINKIRGDF